MNTMSLNVTAVRPRRVWRWSETKLKLAEWRINARSRNELMGLSDHYLQDIGVSCCTGKFASSRQFWMV